MIDKKYSLPITILTPTYNRAKYLERLYKSLVNQSRSDFQWLIIDDGSDDNTQDIVAMFKNHSFCLDYKHKKNGGKHTALNYSHPYIKGKLCCIVDSDDWLLPEAIETILDAWNKYSNIKNVRLLTFLKGKKQNIPLINDFPEKPRISNHIEFRINEKRNGDCCEVLETDVLKEFPFPEFPGEKFMGEGYLWNNAGFKYDTVYIRKVIYICEYLDGGLTKSGRALRIKCPNGGMENCNSFFNDENGRKVNSQVLRKEAWLFVCYGKFAGLKYKEILEKAKKEDLIKRNYFWGLMLYYYWKFKYKKELK